MGAASNPYIRLDSSAGYKSPEGFHSWNPCRSSSISVATVRTVVSHVCANNKACAGFASLVLLLAHLEQVRDTFSAPETEDLVSSVAAVSGT